MNPIEAIWHLFHFVLPALAVGGLSSAMVKVLAGKRLKHLSWSQLWGWCAAAGLGVWLIALVWRNADGTVYAYAMLLAANATVLSAVWARAR